MAFRSAVCRALASPLGAPPPRLFGAAAVTAIVADAHGDERDVLALAEVVATLAGVGVPRGRQFVLLAGEDLGSAAVKAQAERLRSTLGTLVFLHDGAGTTFAPARFEDGAVLELDDELREAEEIVIVGTFAPAARLGVHGGPALLWPGLAPRRDADAWAARLATLPAGSRAGVAHARALAALAHVPARFALLWSGDDPPRVLAGEAPAVFEACVDGGWLGACGR